MDRTLDRNAAKVTQHRLEQQTCMHGNITIVHAQTRHTVLGALSSTKEGAQR